MEKVWFKLRQTDYPPPSEESIFAGSGDDSTAPICLGHFIPDLKHIDFPVNRGAITPFPQRMRVYHTHTLAFKWDNTEGRQTGPHLSAGAPLLANIGMTLKATFQLAFEKSLQEHELYERLDTYTVQPTERYVSECLKSEILRAYVGGKPSWSMFMITGIKIARRGSRNVNEAGGVTVDVGPELDMSTLASATATVNLIRQQRQKVQGQHPGDFVWAVRLAKVHKGLLRTYWSVEPYSSRATFGTGDGSALYLEGVLKKEGVESFSIYDDEKLDEAAVILHGEL